MKLTASGTGRGHATTYASQMATATVQSSEVRKSYYYSRHYIFILFLMTTSVFTSFTIPADNVETRCNIVFSLLLTIVAFNYSCSESIPKVPYATILEKFINSCFLTVLTVGVISFFFSWLAYNDGSTCGDDGDCSHAVGMGVGMEYDPMHETFVGLVSFFLWGASNLSYWGYIFSRKKEVKRMIDEDEQIQWLKFKSRKSAKNPGNAIVMVNKRSSMGRGLGWGVFCGGDKSSCSKKKVAKKSGKAAKTADTVDTGRTVSTTGSTTGDVEMGRKAAAHELQALSRLPSTSE